jgi:hypothetical protein
MKCTVLLVFPCVFTMFYCRNIYFWYISNKHKNTHVPNFVHEMHCFASVFMCFHYVLTAQTCTFGTFHMYTTIQMFSTSYMKCTVLLVFSCDFTAETCTFITFHMYTKIHMYHMLYMKCTVLLVFSCVFMCFH